jgi:hypothetical protein
MAGSTAPPTTQPEVRACMLSCCISLVCSLPSVKESGALTMGDVVSGISTESELFLVLEMHGEQLPLHSIIVLFIVVASDSLGDKR